MSRHLLTVLHAAERSGPPLFALQFLRWLRAEDPSWRTTTLLLDGGGALVPELADLGPVIDAAGRVPYATPRSLRSRAASWALLRSLRHELGRHGRIDVAHVHCLGSMRVVPALPPCPIVGHLHELSVGQDLHAGPRARQFATAAHRYVAVSDGVRDEFLRRFTVDASLVDRQWGFVDPARLDVHPTREALGVADEDLLVLSSGVRHWRKAPELFVRAALRARELAPDFPWRFAWVGGQDIGGLEVLVERSPARDLVQFHPHVDDPLPLVAAADVFVLPAREDAFPLVCVEAAALGRPIVTFDNGGAAELVARADCGTVAPALDVDALARAIVDLASSSDRRKRTGDHGRAFAQQHLLIDQAGPRLRATLATAAGGT